MSIASLLADRLDYFEQSQTIEMAKKSRELKSQGIDVINLSLGEPDFQTPQHIKDAAKQALDDGYTYYSPVAGFPELKEAIVKKLKRDNGLEYSPDNIVVSTGAKQTIANIMHCLINPGDEVIVFAPYWVTYKEIIKLVQGVPVIVNGSIENDFKVTPEQLEAVITPNTKAVIYSSPCNPTGSLFSQEELQGLADVLAHHEQVVVISDEIYEYINFKGNHATIASCEEIKDRVVVVNGFSKGFAMTGWRIGYMAGPKVLAAACEKIQGQFTSGTCSIVQRAAIVALNGDMTPTREMKRAYRSRRNLLIRLLGKIPGFKTNVPQGAFYVFPDISDYFGKSDGESTIENAQDLSMYLLNKAHVSVVTGEAFGAPNCIRLSSAASEDDLQKACDRIKATLTELN